jgi:glycosyltransferase involved in cell wall biosynthesis
MRSLSAAAIPQCDPSVTLQSNSSAYEWFVSKIQKMDRQNDAEAILQAVERAGWFAGNFHPGRFSDGAIENLAFSIGESLDAHAVESKEELIPAVRKDGRRRVLHVTPLIAIGGHKQLLYHWICNDRTSCHSLMLINHTGDVPERFSEAIRDSGGSLVTLPSNAQLCQKARLLREMARSNADLVVWHLIGSEVVPVAAFAKHDCPPILVIDHGDHLFWLGSSIADIVVNLRTVGAELTAERRFGSCISVLPIPLLDPNAEISKIDARRALGVGEDQVMLLSIGRAEKYRPYGSYDFVATANKILDLHPNAHLYVVGESADAITPFLNCKIHERLHFMGSIEDPSIYRTAADIYMESFPFGSQTALLESALIGLPVVPAYAPLFPLLVANDDALTDILQNPKNEQEYINRVAQLIDKPEQRLSLGNELRERLLVDHVGKGWLEQLAALYEKAGRRKHNPRPIPSSSCMMTNMDINLSQWHLTTGKPYSPLVPNDDIRIGSYHKAFVAKTVGDYATARKYAWSAVHHDPLVWASWRLLGIAMMGKAGQSLRQLLSRTKTKFSFNRVSIWNTKENIF